MGRVGREGGVRREKVGRDVEGRERKGKGKGGVRRGRYHISNSGSKVFDGHLSTWTGHLKICVSALLHLPQV